MIVTKVRGHALLQEGAPFNADGRTANPAGGTGGYGQARCECGATSGTLSSGSERRAWHREHKALIRRETPTR